MWSAMSSPARPWHVPQWRDKTRRRALSVLTTDATKPSCLMYVSLAEASAVLHGPKAQARAVLSKSNLEVDGGRQRGFGVLGAPCKHTLVHTL